MFVAVVKIPPVRGVPLAKVPFASAFLTAGSPCCRALARGTLASGTHGFEMERKGARE
jgi:hypothetical protein